MESYKAITIEPYATYAGAFDQKFEKHFSLFVKPSADQFLSRIPGPRVLDLGAGPGNHARYFASKGCRVVCADLSPAMAAHCRQRNLPSIVMDLENLAFKPASFDGIWAYASLLHLKKNALPPLIPKLASLLTPGGYLGVALKEGTGESFETHPDYPDTQRWFSYYTGEELEALVSAHFITVTASRTTSIGSQRQYTFLHRLLRRIN